MEIFFTATLVSIQGNTCTIDVGGLELDGVRLKPTTERTDDEFLFVPAEGSRVLVGSLSGDLGNLFILRADTVSRLEVRTGNMSLTIDRSSIVMNDGKLDGLVNIRQLTDRMNMIERDINALKTVFNSWVTTPQDGGAALKTAAASWAGSTLTQTMPSDMEDVKVKH